MNAKEFYNYLYYKFYKFFFLEESQSMREWRAIGLLVLLEGIIFYTLQCHCVRLFDIDIEKHFQLTTFLVTIIPLGINYYLFLWDNQWKKIVKKYDKWSKKKNRIGTLIAWFVVILVFANFILALSIPLNSD